MALPLSWSKPQHGVRLNAASSELLVWALEAPCPEAVLEMWVLIHLCLSRAAWAAQGLTQDRHTGSACHGSVIACLVRAA